MDDYDDYEWNEQFIEPDYESDPTDNENDLYDSCEESESEIVLSEAYQYPQRPIERWEQVKIGNKVLNVSSSGKYREHDDSIFTPSITGVKMHGTPYRYTVINTKIYYMHDLIWQTFYGPPPAGWEVRHKEEYTTYTKSKVYSNRLSNLDIYPKVVTEREVQFYNQTFA